MSAKLDQMRKRDGMRVNTERYFNINSKPVRSQLS
jgi:hypothetical protein